MQESNNNLMNLLEDIELQSNNLNKFIDEEILKESSKMERFKKRAKNFLIIGITIGSIISSSWMALNIKKNREINAAQTYYYEVTKPQNIEDVLNSICKDKITKNQLISFNKNFDKNFDEILLTGEIVHFPPNSSVDYSKLKSIKNDIILFNSLLRKYETNLSKISTEINKSNVDNLFNIIDKIESDLNKYNHWKNSKLYGQDVKLMIDELQNKMRSAKSKLDIMYSTIDRKLFNLKNNISNLKTNSPELPTYIESYNKILDKTLNDCSILRYKNGKITIQSINKELSKKEKSYLSYVESLKYGINKDISTLDNLENSVKNIFKNGINNNNLKTLYNTIISFNSLLDYSDWENEPRLSKLLSFYKNKRILLRDKLNSLFDYAAQYLNNQLEIYEEEISIGQKTGRIKTGKERLIYLLNNPLEELRQNYYALGYRDGIKRVESLITKVKSYIKKRN